MLTSIVMNEGYASGVTLKREAALPSDKYILKGVDGLGPPDMDARIGTQYYDGGYYQGRRTQTRNIVMRIGLNPDYGAGETVDQLRDELYVSLVEGQYNWWSDQANQVKLVFKDTVKTDRYIWGVVEKFETAHFSSEPDVLVSFLCPYPYFKAEDVLLSVNARTTTFDYDGTKSVGILAILKFTGTSTSAHLNVAGDDMEFVISSQSDPFLSGERLRIDSRTPGMSVKRVPSGETESEFYEDMMHAVQSYAKWPTIGRGSNHVYIYYEGSPPPYIIESISYAVNDWGV